MYRISVRIFHPKVFLDYIPNVNHRVPKTSSCISTKQYILEHKTNSFFLLQGQPITVYIINCNTMNIPLTRVLREQVMSVRSQAVRIQAATSFHIRKHVGIVK